MGSVCMTVSARSNGFASLFAFCPNADEASRENSRTHFMQTPEFLIQSREVWQLITTSIIRLYTHRSQFPSHRRAARHQAMASDGQNIDTNTRAPRFQTHVACCTRAGSRDAHDPTDTRRDRDTPASP